MAKKGTGQNHETDLGLIVKIELETINGKPFYGQATDDELLYIWVNVFNRSRDELFGVISSKSLTRNVRATYKLKTQVDLKSLYDKLEFSYEKIQDDGGRETITGKILGQKKPAEIGDTTRVTVKTNFGVEAAGVLAWLKLYGTVVNYTGFAENPCNPGLKSDVFVAEVTIRRHIPEYLPMYGQKTLVGYPGIPRLCNRCFVSGHLRRDCNNLKKDWIEFVNNLVEENGIKIDMVGSWKGAIARWKNANESRQREAQS